LRDHCYAENITHIIISCICFFKKLYDNIIIKKILFLNIRMFCEYCNARDAKRFSLKSFLARSFFFNFLKKRYHRNMNGKDDASHRQNTQNSRLSDVYSIPSYTLSSVIRLLAVMVACAKLRHGVEIPRTIDRPDCNLYR